MTDPPVPPGYAAYGGDHFRAASRKNAVNVIPTGERDLHLHGGHCPCLPALEVWTVRKVVTHRLMHHPLAPPEPQEEP